MTQWTLPQRQDFIRQLEGCKPIGQHQLEFQGDVRFFHVYVVDIDFTCYRLSNGRTRSAQQEIISKADLSKEFFSADPDSAPALEKQHDILTKMVTVGTDAEILSIFRKSPQTQPLILDQYGYVVNGNRRLCAMRYLLDEDESEYESFRHVQVVFLPPCTPDDIDELEARLQWLPEGRAEYSWVDKAMMLRDRQLSGWKLDKLCKLYEPNRNNIRKSIAMLDDAEAYLEERGWDGEYSRVLRKELAFEKLQRGRAQCGDDEAKKRFFTSVAYLMLDDPEATGRRLYDSIPDVIEFVDDVVDQLRQDFVDDLVNIDVSTDGNLDLLGDDCNSDYSDVAELVAQPSHFDQAREIIRDKLEEMRSRARERKGATYCIRQVQKAYTALETASSNLSSETETEGMDALIDNIEAVCNELRKMLNNIDG